MLYYVFVYLYNTDSRSAFDEISIYDYNITMYNDEFKLYIPTAYK